MQEAIARHSAQRNRQNLSLMASKAKGGKGGKKGSGIVKKGGKAEQLGQAK